VKGTSPPVDFKSWTVCWCVCAGVGIGGKDCPALLDLGGAAYCCQTLAFWCRSGVAPGLPQEWLSDSECGFGREAVPLCAALRDVGPHREGQRKTKVLRNRDRERPKFISGSPERRGSCTHESMSLLGRRPFGMRATCPAQSSMRLATQCCRSNTPVRWPLGC
jgi:hypothetical protein